MPQGAVAIGNDAPHHAAHVLHQNGKCGNEPQSTTIYIMGHSNIIMTLNYYAHATFHSAREEMDRLEAKAEIKVVNTEKPETAA